LSILEILAAVCGLLAVYLTILRSVWCWPVGLVQVLLYTKVFYDARLYSQTFLQLVFAVLQLHGWWQWHQASVHARGQLQDDRIQVERLSQVQLFQWIAIGTCGALVLGWCMQNFTVANHPYEDAILAAFSLVAQWLLIHRKLENWLLWIAVDVLSILVFSAQHLWPTVILYVVFLGMAIQGYRSWLVSATSALKQA
jgi:nicotinamide mononucleotide transporter